MTHLNDAILHNPCADLADNTAQTYEARAISLRKLYQFTPNQVACMQRPTFAKGLRTEPSTPTVKKNAQSSNGSEQQLHRSMHDQANANGAQTRTRWDSRASLKPAHAP